MGWRRSNTVVLGLKSRRGLAPTRLRRAADSPSKCKHLDSASSKRQRCLPRGPFSNATRDYEQVAGSRLLVNLQNLYQPMAWEAFHKGGPSPILILYRLGSNSVRWRRGSGAVDPSAAPLLDPSARTVQNAKLCCLGRCQTVV